MASFGQEVSLLEKEVS